MNNNTTQTNNTQINNSDEIDLLEYLKVILKWRMATIFLCVMALLFSLAVTTFVLKPKYKATVTIFPGEKAGSPNLGAMGGLAGMMGVSLPTADDPSAIYQDILKSRSFLKEYLDVTMPTKKDSLGINLAKYFKIPDNASQSERESAIAGNLADKILFEKVGNVNAISVTTKDPLLSAALANDVVVRLDKYNREKRASKIRKNREFIQSILDDTEKELKTARARLTDFRMQNMRIDVDHAPNLLDQQEWLRQEVEVKASIYAMLKKEYETARIEEEKDKPYLQVLDGALTPSPFYKPQKNVLIVAAVAFAMFCGIFLSFILELISNKKIPMPEFLFSYINRIKR